MRKPPEFLLILMSFPNKTPLATEHPLMPVRGVQGGCARLTSLTSRWGSVVLALLLLPGCSTAVAVADAVGSTIVYAGKTVVNTVDAITPDIVNDDDDD